MGKLFGTDGIRGEANREPMTIGLAQRLGAAVALVLGKRDNRSQRVIIGKDTRLSCYMFEQAIASGLCSMGAEAIFTGPLPTPGISFITTSMRADIGVVISASHNPYQDNGIKLFDRFGFKLPDEVEDEIEKVIEEKSFQNNLPPPSAIGKAYRIDDAQGRYIVHCKNTFPKEFALEDMRVAVDAANGAAYGVAPTIFEELGAKVFATGVNPDGRNINHNCGALFPENVSRAVVHRRANIGLALDGDGDRVIICDERGKIVDGDKIMAILAKDMLEREKLVGKTVVTTVMSNMGFEIALKNLGIKLIRTQVGDRYVVEEMRRGGYVLGGEQSGHIILLEHATTGDGIIAALQTLAVMLRTGKPLSELAGVMETFPQKLINIKVAKKPPIEELKKTSKMIKEFERRLAGKGRILVRYSGTELKARVMIEGESEKLIDEMANEIAKTIKEEIGE
ncbi:MAG: phosphoglucosamine mutase [Myxococcota bacterium]